VLPCIVLSAVKVAVKRGAKESLLNDDDARAIQFSLKQQGISLVQHSRPLWKNFLVFQMA
jgi:hypothetical protein